MERTLILVKPDAFARGLTGEIIARFERKGLTLVALKHLTTSRETAETHYAEHAERPFFGELVDFITSAPLVALILEGQDAIKAARQLIGATTRRAPRRARPRPRRPASSSARRTRSRPRRAPSAATSRSRSARTWSTARTP